MRVALYARVSTLDQHAENQVEELQRYAAARGWESVEYVDRGVSGTRESRPELDRLVADAKRRRFGALVCWRLDRLGRNLRHLILLLDDFAALGVSFVSLGEGIDTSTPAGRLQMHVLGAIAEFERARLAERVRAGLARTRARGTRLGRPEAKIPIDRLNATRSLSAERAAEVLGVSRSTVKRWRRQVHKTSPQAETLSPTIANEMGA